MLMDIVPVGLQQLMNVLHWADTQLMNVESFELVMEKENIQIR